MPSPSTRSTLAAALLTASLVVSTAVPSVALALTPAHPQTRTSPAPSAARPSDPPPQAGTAEARGLTAIDAFAPRSSADQQRDLLSAGFGAVGPTAQQTYRAPSDTRAVAVVREAPSVTAPPPTDPASVQAYAASQLGSHGWDAGQLSCLVQLWNRESGWRYDAENTSSGAYGIAQALPGAKMAVVASDWRTDPRTQVQWGLNYIAGSYGSPCQAWSHETSSGWY